MKKVFLYLYPIEEYTKMFLFGDDRLYDKYITNNPLQILNKCIQKRYRANGYQIVFALYPDRNIFGVTPEENDKIIYTNVTFDEASACDSKGNINLTPKYPNEHLLLEQLGDINELVVGGYHATDCVKRVGETALTMGINTIVDLELTDLFFSLYKQEDYFNIEEYNPLRFKNHMLSKSKRYGEEFDEKHFNDLYSSPVYGFYNEEVKYKK